MIEVVVVIHLLITLALIGIVLVQRNEGGAGLGGLGGGGGAGAGGMAGFMSGRTQASVLTRMTAGLALAFFVTSIVLAVLANQQARGPSIFDQPLPGTVEEQPALPESAPAESETDAPSVPLSE
jgi:preprotein translocase subunit SecG